MTLSPMMSARLLKPHGGSSRFQRFVDRTLRPRSSNWLRAPAAGSLDYRPVTLLIVVALLGTTGFLFIKTLDRTGAGGGPGRAVLGLVNAPRYATADYTQTLRRPDSRR